MTMSSESSSLHSSWRIKELRQRKGWTLEETAQRSGLTKSFLSKIERGKSTPSIATALKLAQAFQTEVGRLFGALEPEEEFVLVKRSERKPFGEVNESGAQYESLSPGLLRGGMEAFIVRPPNDSASRRPVEHKGQELLFVLKGRICVELPSTSLEMEKGDCLQFLADIPHLLRSIGEPTAEVLIVVSSTTEARESAP